MSEAPADVIARQWMARAETALVQGERLVGDEFWDVVVSRAYYATFYAVTALLTSRGLSARSHHAALQLFGREFVKTGRIPGRYGRMLSTLFGERQEADYTPLPDVPADEARGHLADAREFVADARTLLEEILGSA